MQRNEPGRELTRLRTHTQKMTVAARQRARKQGGAAVVSLGEAAPLRESAAQAGDEGAPVGEGGLVGDRRWCAREAGDEAAPG